MPGSPAVPAVGEACDFTEGSIPQQILGIVHASRDEAGIDSWPILNLNNRIRYIWQLDIIQIILCNLAISMLLSMSQSMRILAVKT
jgi:hypothetical protein